MSPSKRQLECPKVTLPLATDSENSLRKPPELLVRTYVVSTRFSDKFGPMVAAEVQRRNIISAIQKVFLADWAAWIWKLHQLQSCSAREFSCCEGARGTGFLLKDRGRLWDERIEESLAVAPRAQREATHDGVGMRPCFVVQRDFFSSSCRASLARWASSSSSLAKPAR